MQRCFHRRVARRSATGLVAVFFIGAMAAPPAAAQGVADFYRGKQITFMVVALRPALAVMIAIARLVASAISSIISREIRAWWCRTRPAAAASP